ncbi:unnamed protein product [Amoebophrya sp. A25]|nr:unnamed protein product [Amoebophrya sp. A25]|eukprot:GSA25T00027619001.1
MILCSYNLLGSSSRKKSLDIVSKDKGPNMSSHF